MTWPTYYAVLSCGLIFWKVAGENKSNHIKTLDRPFSFHISHFFSHFDRGSIVNNDFKHLFSGIWRRVNKQPLARFRRQTHKTSRSTFYNLREIYQQHYHKLLVGKCSFILYSISSCYEARASATIQLPDVNIARARKNFASNTKGNDHDKMNFYGRIAIFTKLGAHGPNRRTSGPKLRPWQSEFLRPNSNFHEVGCSRPKSAHKRSPSSDHGKMNFYGRIAIFMKLGAHGPNRRKGGLRAQIMAKWIFTTESQFLWNWVLTAQIGAQAVPQFRSWQNEFLRPNRNFYQIGYSRPKSAHNRSPSSDHGKMNFSGGIPIFMKFGANGPNRPKSGNRAQSMAKWLFTAESQFS